jgi:hypothetical protein
MLVLLVTSTTVSGVGQTSPGSAAGTGAIGGQVLDGSSGEPRGGVKVVLRAISEQRVAGVVTSKAAPRNAEMTTDHTGRFLFSGVPAGQYDLSFSGDEVLGGRLNGQSVADLALPAPRLDLAPGERAERLLARVWRVGSIAGIASDGNGEPL